LRRPSHDAASVGRLREEVELGIYDLLEEQLQKAPTNNHWMLFDRLYPPSSPEEPCVISTNYDLIADAALMYLSESRPTPAQEGRLPDYRCSISTPFYRGEHSPMYFAQCGIGATLALALALLLLVMPVSVYPLLLGSVSLTLATLVAMAISHFHR
jgi:hypothetical protein